MSPRPLSALRLLPVLLHRRLPPPPPSPSPSLLRPLLALSLFTTGATLRSDPPASPLASSLRALRISIPSFPYPRPSAPITSLDRALLDLRCLLDQSLTPPHAATATLQPALAAVAAQQSSAAARAYGYVHAALTATSDPRGALLSRVISARRAADDAALRAALARPGLGVREAYEMRWEVQRRRREGLRVLAGVVEGSGVVRWVVGGVLGVPEGVLALARGLGEEGGDAGRGLRDAFRGEVTELVEGGVVVRELVRWVKEGGEGTSGVKEEEVLERVCEVLAAEVLAFVNRFDGAVREVEREKLGEVGLWAVVREQARKGSVEILEGIEVE